MAGKSRSLHTTRLEAQVFGAISAEQVWTPAVNVYECGAALHVCVELAGVRRETMSVSVQSGRLTIEGRREVPEPEAAAAQCIREMEIDHGLFRRVLTLSDSIDHKTVKSEYRDGMLWIILPVKR